MKACVQARDDHERALTEGEARLADMEARVASQTSNLYQLEHEVIQEAGQHSAKPPAERLVRHLEHLIDSKGTAVERFTMQAAALKVFSLHPSTCMLRKVPATDLNEATTWKMNIVNRPLFIGRPYGSYGNICAGEIEKD